MAPDQGQHMSVLMWTQTVLKLACHFITPIHVSIVSFTGSLIYIRTEKIIKYQTLHLKDAECIQMFLCTMPGGVPDAHFYVLKLPLHHL